MKKEIPKAMRDSLHQEMGLRDMCKFLKSRSKNPNKILEVGSFCGESARIFCQEFPSAIISCMDPWLPNYDDNDPASHVDMSIVESRFDRFMSGRRNVLKHKGTSEDFKNLEYFSSFCFCYIDGCHTYDAVKKDINTWMPRCKVAICGHDYGIKNHWLSCVTDAVQDTVGKPDAVFSDTSWLKLI